jgi:hypothetical protein
MLKFTPQLLHTGRKYPESMSSKSKAGWASEPIWMLWRTEKFVAPAGNQTTTPSFNLYSVISMKTEKSVEPYRVHGIFMDIHIYILICKVLEFVSYSVFVCVTLLSI